MKRLIVAALAATCTASNFYRTFRRNALYNKEIVCDKMANLGEQKNRKYWETKHRHELFQMIEINLENRGKYNYGRQVYRRDPKKEGVYSQLKKMATPEKTPKKAKNVILFVGDGMNIDSVAGGRISAGVNSNSSCDGDFVQSLEKDFTTTGWSEVYAVDKQTPDSAVTSTALHNGVKGNMVTIGVSAKVNYNTLACKNLLWKAGRVTGDDCLADKSIYNRLKTARGKEAFQVGLVTTTHYAHATPASGYACHSCRMNYDMITDQFEERLKKDDIDVSFSGGYSKLEDRIRGLKVNHVSVITKKDELAKAAWTGTRRRENKAIVGVFNGGNMPYSDESVYADKPNLEMMAAKALDLVKEKSTDGFFLLIEGATIDKGHHAGFGERALDEVKQFDETIANTIKKLEKAGILDETLIIATADHGHTFNFVDSGARGQKVTNTVKSNEKLTGQDTDTTRSGYYTGPGGQPATNLCALKHKGLQMPSSGDELGDANSPKLHSAVKMTYAAHSGEDVPVYARGPFSELLTGHYEQSYIAQVMMYATCVGEVACATDVDGHNALGAPHCQEDCRKRKTA